MESRIGALMPATVTAATDTEPIAKCGTAAMSHASRMLEDHSRRPVDLSQSHAAGQRQVGG